MVRRLAEERLDISGERVEDWVRFEGKVTVLLKEDDVEEAEAELRSPRVGSEVISMKVRPF